MINMAHHRNNRRTLNRMIRWLMKALYGRLFDILTLELHINAKLLDNNLRGFKINPLIDRGNDAIFE